MRSESLYEVLGVAAEASAEELVRARRRELMRWHPDHNPDHTDLATDRVIAIETAFAALADPVRRAVHDAELTPAACGGWLRGVDVDDPAWRPPAWSWVGADPVRDLRRHRQFFVRTLEELPDVESVLLSTANGRVALLVTDRRVLYSLRGVRRRDAEVSIEAITGLLQGGRSGRTSVLLVTRGGWHRLPLAPKLAHSVAETLRTPR